MNNRVRVYYSGSVQGVGFRYTARSIAQRLNLKGWVRNMNDGAVEMVAEGEETSLKDLLKQVKEELNYTSFKETVSWEPATGEFPNFEIRY